MKEDASQRTIDHLVNDREFIYFSDLIQKGQYDYS